MEDILNIGILGDWHFLSIGGNNSPQRMHGNAHGLSISFLQDKTATAYNKTQLNIQCTTSKTTN
jgi:hypothetical protein